VARPIWRCLEVHHIAGRDFDNDATAILCRNCHRKLSDDLKDHPPAGPSEYVLVFDTETTTDPSQRLRFGCYQFWKGDTLIEAGLFFDPSLPSAEQELLAAFPARAA
jgi:hypothetical protein